MPFFYSQKIHEGSERGLKICGKGKEEERDCRSGFCSRGWEAEWGYWCSAHPGNVNRELCLLIWSAGTRLWQFVHNTNPWERQMANHFVKPRVYTHTKNREKKKTKKRKCLLPRFDLIWDVSDIHDERRTCQVNSCLCWVLTPPSQMCFCSGRVPAWDNQERSALTVSSFKVFQQLCWTNKHTGEVSNGEPGRNNEEVRRWRGKWAEDASVCRCLYQYSCLYVWL